MTDPYERIASLPVGDHRISSTPPPAPLEERALKWLPLILAIFVGYGSYVTIQEDTRRLKEDHRALSARVDTFSKSAEQVARLEEKLSGVATSLEKVVEKLDRFIISRNASR